MFSQPKNAQKMHWRPGLRPTPRTPLGARGAYSAPPDPLRGSTSKGRGEREGRGWGKEGRLGEGRGERGGEGEGEERGGEGNAPPVSEILKTLLGRAMPRTMLLFSAIVGDIFRDHQMRDQERGSGGPFWASETPILAILTANISKTAGLLLAG